MCEGSARAVFLTVVDPVVYQVHGCDLEPIVAACLALFDGLSGASFVHSLVGIEGTGAQFRRVFGSGDSDVGEGVMAELGMCFCR